MQLPEQGIMGNLYAALCQKYGENGISVLKDDCSLTVQRTAGKGVTSCVILCSGFPHDKAKWLIFFDRDSERIAESSMRSFDEVLHAVEDWLDGVSLDLMYVRYPDVDRFKREMQSLRHSIYVASPLLESVNVSEISSESSVVHDDGCFQLDFTLDERACQVRYGLPHSEEEFVRAVFAEFFWDETSLFISQVQDIGNLGEVMHAWLCDKAMPSSLRERFGWLRIGKLADYYEAGDPVTGEYMQSWDIVEEYFRDTLKYYLCLDERVLSFLKDLRTAGYERTLRAGTCRGLMLSRSRRHGLLEDQPYVEIEFELDHMRVQSTLCKKQPSEMKIELTDELRNILDELAAQPIC